MRSDFLFAQPGFICGIGRLVDLFGLFDSYNQSPTTEEADAKGLYSDWRITGEDLLDASLILEAEAKAAKSEFQIPLFANQ